MKSEPIPPNQTISSILHTLNLKNIQELINGDSFNLDTLAKTTSLHPTLIQAHINTIHAHLSPSPSLSITSPPPPNLKLAKIIDKWLYPSKQQLSQNQEGFKLNISEGDIVELVGRVGGGKSYMLNEIIIECILNQIELVYLDGSNSLNSLLYRIHQQEMHNPYLKTDQVKLRTFAFKTQAELIMILHSLGSWISQAKGRRPWIFIDSLVRTDQLQIDNAPSVNALEFKSAEKMKRMLFQLSQLSGAIVFTTKCMNLNGLFQGVYKHEKHRPKGVGACSKQWDNIANKTVCLDFARTHSGIEHLWINLSKDPNCKIFKLQRQR